ncbi:MAG: hypothetical protein ACOY3P_06540 [Planctomycetota bacterium]
MDSVQAPAAVDFTHCRPRHAVYGWLAAVGLALAIILLGGGDASAHALNIFATVKDGRIHGKVYFRGQFPAQHVKVKAFDPKENLIASTTTNDLGEFSITPTRAVDYRLVVDAGEGHGAEQVIKRSELPPPLGSEGFEESVGGVEVESASTADGGESADERSDSAESRSEVTGADPQLAAALKELRDQVSLLREEIEAQRNRTRLSDIVSGIGYIAGIAGVVFYFLGTRKNRVDPARLVGRTRWQ